MALNELSDLLYEAARDIEGLAREFAWAGGDASDVNRTAKGDPAFSKASLFPTTRLNQLRCIGLPVLAAMKWDAAKLEALRHALAIEQATQ